MPVLPFTAQMFRRPKTGQALLRQKNTYVEVTANPDGSQDVAFISRPGLVTSYSVGEGPIRALFQQDGTFGGDRIAVSAANVYRNTAPVITGLSGQGVANISASASQLALIEGGTLYIYDGTTGYAVVNFTDSSGAPTTDHLPVWSYGFYLGGRFYYLQANSGRIYFSDIGHAERVQALSYFNAESSPDGNVAGGVLADEAYIFGTRTVEIFYQTGNDDAPLARSQGRRYEKGCAAAGTLLKLDNALFWVGVPEEGGFAVYRTGATPVRVSMSSVEEALRKSTNVTACTAWSLGDDGHAFLVLGIPGQTTFVYDVMAGQWAEWSSFNRTTFRGRSSVNVGGVTFVGDDQLGRVWALSDDAFTDDGAPIERINSAFAKLPGGVIRCTSLMIQCVRGVGATSETQATVQMRYSDDGGRTWSGWLAASIGKRGEFQKKAIWRGLGLMQSPGRNFEWRCTDPVDYVANYATINEARP